MRIPTLPWLELSIVLAILGSLWVASQKQPARAARWGIIFTGATFLLTVLAWLSFATGTPAEANEAWSPTAALLGRRLFTLDELSAPLVPAVALLHFLTALATARAQMRYFSFSWSLASEAFRLAMFSCRPSWLLVALIAIPTVPAYFELVNRRKPTRVFVIHMSLFVGLMVLGWAGVESSGGSPERLAISSIPLMIAILIRCGTVPAHCWLTDWFEHVSLGNAMLFVAPLSGVLAAVRLVLPIAPDWVLSSIAVSSLVTAAYAAAMGTIQRETRRLFAYLFLSNASLVLVGLELHTELSLTASLCLWFSALFSLGGFGLTLRALESRFGRLSLTSYHGLYPHTPTLAVCFLLTGLACVGFPGTLGFISAELLVDSAVEANPWIGVFVVAAGALNGIAVMRAYFSLFTGARHHSSISLRIGDRERAAVLTLAALILGGGLFPAPGVATRYRAASEILRDRDRRTKLQTEPPSALPMPAPLAQSVRPKH
jgi:NADH-quinone oxidoreductase subunit M